MEFEGRVWKEGKQWLVEITSLDLMTQGKTRKEALFMIEDAIKELIRCYFKSSKVKIKLISYEKDVIAISASDSKILLALSLRRLREKENLTIRDMVIRLKFKSPNSYFQYETGKVNISFEQHEKLLLAINPSMHYLFKLA